MRARWILALGISAALSGSGAWAQAYQKQGMTAAKPLTAAVDTALTQARANLQVHGQVLNQWRSALQSWHGVNFLLAPGTPPFGGTLDQSSAYHVSLLNVVLPQWAQGIQSRAGRTILTPIPTVSSGGFASAVELQKSQVQLTQVLRQWWTAMESWRGTHFLHCINVQGERVVSSSGAC